MPQVLHRKTVPHIIVAQVLMGRYEIEAGGRTEWIGPGEAFITPPLQPLHIVHHGEASRGHVFASQWAHFQYTLYESIDVCSLLRIPLRLDAARAAPFGQLIAQLRTGTPENAPGLGAYLRRHSLGLDLLRLTCEVSEPDGAGLARLAAGERLAPVLRHIRENMASTINVPALAQAAAMSASRFHAVFREHLGMPPMEYVKRARLAEACRQLASGTAPVADIAEATGFSNPFHFSREFKRAYQITPSQYRSQHREQH